MAEVTNIRTTKMIKEEREKRIDEFNKEYGIEAVPGESRLITLNRMRTKIDYTLAGRWMAYQLTGDESLFKDKMEKRRAEAADQIERAIKEEEDDIILEYVQKLGFKSEAEFLSSFENK